MSLRAWKHLEVILSSQLRELCLCISKKEAPGRASPVAREQQRDPALGEGNGRGVG